MKKKEISVVIPCFQSSENIQELNERLIVSLDAITDSYEIIYINDSSPDDTFDKLKGIVVENSKIKVIDLMCNVGQFKALMCGYKHTNGRYVITMDDDLQHPPEEIVKLYNAIKEDPDIDIVIGSAKEKKHNILRRLGSIFVNRIYTILFSKPVHLKMGSFRCMTEMLKNTVLLHTTVYPMMGPLILSSTNRIINIEFDHEVRANGKSGYSYKNLIKITFNNIFNFSSLPLRIIGYIGLVSFVASLTIIIWVFIKKMFAEVTVEGWTSLVLFINLYSGLILVSIGIIGEYMIRILNESRGEPLYAEREIICGEKSVIDGK